MSKLGNHMGPDPNDPDICQGCGHSISKGECLIKNGCPDCFNEYYSKEITKLQAENERLALRVNNLMEHEAELVAENERLKKAIKQLLLSADCSWEEKEEGHDWALACSQARQALEEVKDE
jgi:predicted  nucleic acid-binding Zn-ribbon protein